MLRPFFVRYTLKLARVEKLTKSFEDNTKNSEFMPNNLKALSVHGTMTQEKIPLGTLQFASTNPGFFAAVGGFHASCSKWSEKMAMNLVNRRNVADFKTNLYTSLSDEIVRNTNNNRPPTEKQFYWNHQPKTDVSETQLETGRKHNDKLKEIPSSSIQSSLPQTTPQVVLHNNINRQHEIFQKQNTVIGNNESDSAVIQTERKQAKTTSPLPHFNLLFHFGRKGEDFGEFEEPVGVTYNPQGEIVVADYNNDRLQVVSKEGEIIQVHDSYSRESGKRFAFFSPTGVACDSLGNMAVVEKARNRIVVLSPAGTILRAFGRHGKDPAQFRGPHGVSIDARNRIIIADTMNSRIQVFDQEGNFLFLFGNKGPEKLNYPCYAIFHTGRFYVADTDNDCLKVFDTRGTFLRKFGEGLNAPSGIAVYKDKYVLVCDYSNDCLKIFSLDGRLLSKIGTCGQGWGQFNGPEAVTVCSTEGKIAVTDKLNCRLQVLDLMLN